MTREWLIAWVKRRYKWGEHVPLPSYLLLSVFFEALEDYAKEQSKAGNARTS